MNNEHLNEIASYLAITGVGVLEVDFLNSVLRGVTKERQSNLEKVLKPLIEMINLGR